MWHSIIMPPGLSCKVSPALQGLTITALHFRPFRHCKAFWRFPTSTPKPNPLYHARNWPWHCLAEFGLNQSRELEKACHQDLQSAVARRDKTACFTSTATSTMLRCSWMKRWDRWDGKPLQRYQWWRRLKTFTHRAVGALALRIQAHEGFVTWDNVVNVA